MTLKSIKELRSRSLNFPSNIRRIVNILLDEVEREMDALVSGECEENEPDGWHKCPECGCVVGYWLLVDDSWTIYMDDYQIPFNNCPNCGKAVKQ